MIEVRFVRSDGTVTVSGLRVRVAAGGDGEAPGCLGDEMRRQVQTPVLEGARDALISQVTGSPALRQFVEGLPIARLSASQPDARD